MYRSGHRGVRQGGRAIAMIAAIAVIVVMVPGTALANHGTAAIEVGRTYTGATGNFFHIANKTMYVGQTATFSFVAGSHNVGIDTGSLPGGAAAFRSPQFAGGGAEPLSSTYNYAFAVAGTYNYYCSVHASQADTATTYDANGVPANGKMVGRITVTTDASAPTWAAGTPTATAVSASQIDLTWPAASDAETGISQYRVYEATGATRPAKPGTASATPTGTSLSRTGLTSGLHYWYWVTAVNGAGLVSATDQLMDATTSSVAASATASGVVMFAVNPTLSITVSPAILDLGTVNPAAASTGTQIVNVKSNDVWSLTLKSIGRDAVDGAPGDDAVFTGAGGATIPVSRLSWKVGAGSPAACSDTAATVLSAQSATSPSGTNTSVDLSLLVQYSDPVAIDYQTVLLYTATQP